jgi:hypothetical protein
MNSELLARLRRSLQLTTPSQPDNLSHPFPLAAISILIVFGRSYYA